MLGDACERFDIAYQTVIDAADVDELLGGKGPRVVPPRQEHQRETGAFPRSL